MCRSDPGVHAESQRLLMGPEGFITEVSPRSSRRTTETHGSGKHRAPCVLSCFQGKTSVRLPCKWKRPFAQNRGKPPFSPHGGAARVAAGELRGESLSRGVNTGALSSQPHRFDLFERRPIHTRSTVAGACQAIRVVRNVRPPDLAVKDAEPEISSAAARKEIGSCAPVRFSRRRGTPRSGANSDALLKRMVGATGIEPVTPAV